MEPTSLKSHTLAGGFFTTSATCEALFIYMLLLLLLSCFSRVRLCATPYTAAHQAPRPWDSQGKNTGVGCHFLLQCMKVKSLSRVRPSATPWTAAFQAPPSMGFSRQEYWSRVPLPSPVYIYTFCLINTHYYQIIKLQGKGTGFYLFIWLTISIMCLLGSCCFRV